MSHLVIRFSSIGDIVLTAAVTGALAPVSFVTLSRHAELAAALPGVREVFALHEDESLWSFARTLPRGLPIVDLHGSPRSRALCLLLGGRVSRLDRASLGRRLRVAFKTRPAESLVSRYARAAGVSIAPLPWIQVKGPRDALLLIPGASQATKRWPAERFIELASALPGPQILLGGPADRALCEGIAQASGQPSEILCEQGFQAVLGALGRGRAALGCDTGLSHLCAAAGIPTVVLFGPTCAQDGYWDQRAHALETSLSCRPCGRFGADRCPMGDHLCMDGIGAPMATALLRDLLS